MPDTTTTEDAIQLLTADHRKVEDLFAKFENARGLNPKQDLVDRICTELKIHAMIEEEIFYPALRGRIEDALLDEAYVEHDGAKFMINDLAAAEPDEEFYDAKVSVLKEQIEHHVYEEEKMNGNMFSQARKAEVDLVALGEQMKARQQALMAEAESAELPPATPTTVDAGRGTELPRS